MNSRKLVNILDDMKEANAEGMSVTFAGEAFNELYDEVLKINEEHMSDLKFATSRGILIGAAGVGLTWLGVAGWKRFKNRNPKDNTKKKVIKKPGGSNESQPEVIDKDGNVVKRVSRKDRNKDALAEIIDEIDNNGRVVN